MFLSKCPNIAQKCTFCFYDYAIDFKYQKYPRGSLVSTPAAAKDPSQFRKSSRVKGRVRFDVCLLTCSACLPACLLPSPAFTFADSLLHQAVALLDNEIKKITESIAGTNINVQEQLGVYVHTSRHNRTESSPAALYLQRLGRI